MNFVQLPDDWPSERNTLHRLATHVLARAQASVTGHIALTALPGGFGTPQFGSDRRRVRLAGGPFGATLGFGQLDAADNPLSTACEFFLHGIADQRM